MEINQLNLEQICKVVQTNREIEVNEYLDQGWTLLSLHLTDYGHPVERHQSTVFTLGWSKQKGEVKFPEKPDYNSLNRFVQG